MSKIIIQVDEELAQQLSALAKVVTENNKLLKEILRRDDEAVSATLTPGAVVKQQGE